MILLLPPKEIAAEIKIPGSKSITNRALVLASLAKGKTTLKNASFCEDTFNMISALRALGIPIERDKKTISVEGKGGKFKNPERPLDLANTGTAVRFLTALASLIPGKTIITGSKRIQERPIHDLTETLRKLGVKIEDTNGCPPVHIEGPTLKGGKTEIQGDKSSQYLSALLMVAPYAKTKTIIEITGSLTSKPYIEITLDLIKKFGGSVTIKGSSFLPGKAYKSQDLEVEADASSAMYFCGIAALSGGKITIKNLSSKTKQADIGCLELFKKMGCAMGSAHYSKNKKEAIEGFMIEGPKKLKPLGTIDMNEMPDAVMTIAVVSAFADGETIITNIGNLRIKESDRLEALETELQKIGIRAKASKDSITIKGNKDPSELRCITVETYGDHRIAMAFSLASLKIPFLRIADENIVAKSYPEFWNDLSKIGFIIKKNLTKNIILTGMRGTGKTLLGKAIARNLGYRFIDTDREIERSTNKHIREIVHKKGWFQFRKLEKYVVRNLAHLQNHVIATGGGTLLSTDNKKKLHRNGIIVLLTAKPEIMEKRIAQDRNRPSLTGKPHTDEVGGVWEKRKSRYLEFADIVYDTSHHTLFEQQDIKNKTDDLLKLIIDKL